MNVIEFTQTRSLPRDLGQSTHLLRLFFLPFFFIEIGYWRIGTQVVCGRLSCVCVCVCVPSLPKYVST